MGRVARTPRQLLAAEPARFSFDAAIRILLHAARTGDPARAAAFESPPDLSFPAAEVRSVTADEPLPRLLTSVIGMTGPSGVLPRGYTELVTAALRDRAPGLHRFLDLLANRFVAHYAAAGIKYRVHRAVEAATLDRRADPVGGALLAFTGHANAGVVSRLPAGAAAVQHYAGLFAARPRSADRLAAMLADWLGWPVAVRQFAGGWLAVPPAERTRLPRGRTGGAFCRLGVDAAIGVQVWEPSARIVLVVGPLDQGGFAALLPGGAALTRLVSLVRAFVGLETDVAVNPVLRRDAVPPLRLDAAAGPAARLGWNTWLTAPAGRRTRDADDAVFEAARVKVISVSG